MNKHAHKVIFSQHLGQLVVVGENASHSGKSAGGERSATPAAAPAAAAGGFYLGALRSIFAAGLLCVGGLGVMGQAQALDANALPTGQSVQAGGVDAPLVVGNTMNIVQRTSRAVVNYETFNIGRDAAVVHTGGVMLARVTGAGASQIHGTLTTSGMVLVNPNGIAIGSTANINAGSFTASTLNISNDNFMAGNMVFERNGATGSVVNAGTIQQDNGLGTEGGGYVALVGASVTNSGTITTAGGEVIMAAADTVTIAPRVVGVPLSRSVRLELAPEALEALQSATVSNSGVIVTDGGQVLMRAAAIVDAVSKVANATVIQSGSIDTTGVQGGGVDILADHGRIRVSGSVKANSTNGTAGGDIYIGRDKATNILAAIGDASGARLESKGGFVETSGHFLAINGTRVLAKDWLLDPFNVFIRSNPSITSTDEPPLSPTEIIVSPGQNDSVFFVEDIVANLNAGAKLTIQTTNPNSNEAQGTQAGNITVEQSITKTADNEATLTLKAHNDIVINSGVGITSTSGKLHVVFNSDSDGDGAGAIHMNRESSILSNGGNITMGGGNEQITAGEGFAKGSAVSGRVTGIALVNATVSANGPEGQEGGSIIMNGEGSGVALENNSSMGVDIQNSKVTTNGNGSIHINGKGGKGGHTNVGIGVRGNQGALIQGGSTGSVRLIGTGGTGGDYNFGVWVSDRVGNRVTTSGGSLMVQGTAGGDGSSQYNTGVMVQNGASITANDNGSIDITGKGGQSTGGNNHGVEVLNNASINTAGGTLKITGDSTPTNHQTPGFGLSLQNGGKLSTSNADITIKADSFSSIVNTSTIQAGNEKTVTLQNLTESTLINVGGSDVLSTGSPRTLGISQGELDRITAGKLVIGDTANTGGITVSQAITTGVNTGNLELQTGGDIVIKAVLNVGDNPQTTSVTETTKNLALNAAGATSNVSQTAAIKASGLQLLGDNATHTLTEDNSISTLAARVQSLTLNNKGPLVIDTVNGTEGITATGNVATGNVTITSKHTTAQTNPAAAISVKKAIQTTNGGAITLTGTNTADASFGVFTEADVKSDTGNITITGTNNSPTRAAVLMGFKTNDTESPSNIQTQGAIKIQGTNQGNGVGVALESVASLTVLDNSNAGGITLTGRTADANGNAVRLSGNIKSNKGDVLVEALGTGAILSTTGATIVQKDNANVSLIAEQGNVTVAKIIHNGTGDVVIAAGSSLNAGGTGDGGQVKTIAGNTIANSGTTRIYTGNTSDTDDLAHLLNGSLTNLYLAQVGDNAQNTAFNKDFTSGSMTTTSPVQVFFREKSTIGENAIAGAALVKTYGGTNTSNSEAARKALLSEALNRSPGNSGTNANVEKTTNAGKLIIAKSTLIDDLVSVNSAPTLTDAAYSGAGFLRANDTTAYNFGSLTAGTQHGTTLTTTGNAVTVKVNRRDASIAATPTNRTADGTVQTQDPVTTSGFLTNDVIEFTGGVATGTAVGTYNLPLAVGNTGDESNYIINLSNADLVIAAVPDPVPPTPDPFPAPDPVIPSGGGGTGGGGTVAPFGNSNPFELASASELLESDVCSVDNLAACSCEEAKDEQGKPLGSLSVCSPDQQRTQIQ